MSALGHKRTYAVQQPMSALPPIATAKAKFRKTHAPQQKGSLFDHLAASREQADISWNRLERAYVSFTFQKTGALNLRTSRTFFRKAVG